MKPQAYDRVLDCFQVAMKALNDANSIPADGLTLQDAYLLMHSNLSAMRSIHRQMRIVANMEEQNRNLNGV